METLLALVERHGHLVTKEELLRIVWPDAFVEENNLAQHISALRRALGDIDGAAPYIETVPRRGYRFAGGVVRQVARDGKRRAGGRAAGVDAGAAAAGRRGADDTGRTRVAAGEGCGPRWPAWPS